MTQTIKGGPVAPKDPEKMRPYFYIMRNKGINSSPKPDGKGVSAMFQDMGRMISSMKIVGGIQDEEILGLPVDVEGFRKLVYSIGVTVLTQNPADEVDFVFQMYGKTDPYVSGTNIVKTVKANGAEHIIKLEEINWSEDDNVPGQIRFEFDKPGTFAEVSVAFYLNDGYDAPKPEEDFPVDFTKPAYRTMLEKSLVQTGNPNRIKRALEKARKGEDVTICYIGGSITQGAGAVPINTKCYAYQSFLQFCQLAGKGPDENIHYVKAGVGGTPSEFGILRYERDVLNDGEITPDVVVVEFAVNDEGDETKGECYDSLVRKIYDGPGNPAVILMFAVFADDWNLQERLSPVGYAYDLPMVSVKDAVVEQFYQPVGPEKVMSKIHFFYDSFHPTNYGHTVMADGIGYLLKQADTMPYAEESGPLREKEAPIGGAFSDVKFFDKKNIPADVIIDAGSFTKQDTDIQAVERNLDLFTTPEFPDNWLRDETKENIPFTMDLTCSTLFLLFKDTAAIDNGAAEIYVDGELVLTVDPKEVGWTHCHPIICFRERPLKNYHVEVKMQSGDEDKKFTILGWGYVE